MKSKLPRVKESDLQKSILDWLKLQSHWCDAWKVPIGPMLVHRGSQIGSAPNPLKGFPDICGVINGGKMFAIEVKASTSLGPEQKTWRDRLQCRGVLWLEARSLDSVISFFQKHLGVS